ncbi:adenylate/guanylate cyclase domain-containing protein [Maridesulfovibrio ferrireducens]|uniref:adenylate/guanylate cyclase domain-containing protein n=1 Tax=Maridesulfovibrio ferrireducens TaxID=246191 RepID=UPI001A302A26|nr:adenylate/guanylate cyclase domain-containing protein [Maridesulfovibrio ferrireducens]MBI9113323.1 adenylate/guanylate cyclase domain-containing protein [Maridesulfovibrio ferrireducens]
MFQNDLSLLERFRSAFCIFNALLISLVISFFTYSGYFDILQELILDNMHGVRSKLSPPPAAEVVLIGINDKTFLEKEFRKPFLLWHEDLAELIDSLRVAKAKVIGLDFLLPDVLFDDYVPGYSQVWLKSILKSKLAGIPVVTGFMDLGDSVIAPHAYFLQAIGKDHCGFFNLTTDDDGVVRRQNLWVKNNQGQIVNSFSLAILKAAGTKINDVPKQVRINFRPEETHFKIYELSDVMHMIKERRLDYLKKNFSQKIVLVGAMDIRNQDRHPTPLFNFTARKSRKSSGVVIQAQIVETILDDQHFSEFSNFEKWAISFLLAFAAIGPAIWSTHRFKFVWAPIFLTAYLLVCSFAFFQYIIMPVASGALSIVLSYILSILLSEGVLNAEQRKLKKVFQRYLPASIAESLLKQNDADFFKGDSRELCILFSDIRSFTTYSENRPPKEIVRRLNKYFEAMAEIVNKHNGVVDKFIGDGLLAFFGVIESDVSPSLCGIRVAIEMHEVLGKLNKEWAKDGEPKFEIGIGLHTGNVMVGNIGSKYKAEFTVIGDAVNLASRLEHMTKTVGAPILISETVKKDVIDVVDLEPRGKVKIKGRNEEFVYSVLINQDKSGGN